MRHLGILGLAAVAAMALTAFTAGSASATTLELNGFTQNKAVTVNMSLTPFTSSTFSRTDGTTTNSCTSAQLEWQTGTYTGSSVSGTALFQPSFSGCVFNPIVVHNPGVTSTFKVEHSPATTSGTVTWAGGVITLPTSFGFTATCDLGAGFDIGKLTGVSAGNGTMHVNAVLNCGFLLPSVTWRSTYRVTTEGLGVSA